MTVSEDNWPGCYTDGWQGEIVEDAFQHPAKFSRALIRRIYQHALDKGWIAPGDVVLDCFGGVALGSLDAMWNGCLWVGCELEERFVILGRQNIERFTRRYGNKTGWGSAILLNGDSRQLASVIQQAALVVSSPPYAGNSKSDYLLSEDGKTRQRDVKRGYKQGHGCFRGSETYGQTPGQLGTLKEGDLDAVISSPPYANSEQSHDGDFTLQSTQVNPTPRKLGSRSYFPADMSTPGQLGNLDAVVSSPPYEGIVHNGNGIDQEKLVKYRPGKNTQAKNEGYGVGKENLGNSQGDNFWSASRTILEQCFLLLRPSGVAIFVTKDFVRDKQRVPFSDQWQQLCEAVGFHLVCRHRALLVESYGEQGGLFGGSTKVERSKKSFFRRLAEKKGSPRIDHEDVLCMRKPLPPARPRQAQGGLFREARDTT
jgi:hypothetical protein